MEGILRRSTKARVRTPATPEWTDNGFSSLEALNEGQGSNPGDTASSDEDADRHRRTLNEGQGSNPGDTREVALDPVLAPLLATLNEGQGSNPGDTAGRPA